MDVFLHKEGEKFQLIGENRANQRKAVTAASVSVIPRRADKSSWVKL